ncbi:MAG: CTP synthase (glutamine hydrolyzing) [Methanomicrobia archaeon]|nr:CTP synthase (glutamine hydrolyzing) [Methanomicrobia archaeon]
MRYIIVTGGVLSGLGKGVTTASIAKILQSMRYKVTVIKIDPYLNVDAGTMSPFEHGEVFVLHDGGEVDLDLGNYERFLNVDLTRDHNITTGKIYKRVIEKERRGDYLGKTVQPIPHLTDEIKSEIRIVGENYDFTVIEVGGTVGDIESMPFLEAGRQLSWEEDVVFVHVTLVPSLDVVGEQKTKPTQHSVKKLMETGISPHMIVCRSKTTLLEKTKRKIALFCNVSEDHVISNHDVDDIYTVPLLLNEQKIGEKIIDKFGLRRKPNLERWRSIISKKYETEVTLAMIGKYMDLHDSYISIGEALRHCSYYTGAHVNIKWLESESIKKEDLEDVDGILVPGGFGVRGTEEKIRAITYAREKKIPFLGICLGFQLATIEYARSIGLKNANSMEFAETDEPVIDLLPEQKKIKNMGGTMRLGAYKIILDEKSTVYSLYKSKEIYERHRHRYEVNPEYIDLLTKNGVRFTGKSEDGRMEVLELEDYPFFIGTQYHPEFTSRVERPSPVFMGLVKAMGRKKS